MKEYYENFRYTLDMHFHHNCFKFVTIMIMNNSENEYNI